VLRQHCHDIGLATYVVTLNDELFQFVVTLFLTCLYLGLGLGLGLGTCWTRYKSESKVKAKLTDLLKFRKLDSSTSNSSAILAWRSQFIVDYDSMRPTLQLSGARFLNFFPVGGHVTSKFAIC